MTAYCFGGLYSETASDCGAFFLGLFHSCDRPSAMLCLHILEAL